MNLTTYKRLRMAVAMFISILVSIAVTQDNFWLALAAVITGMIFMFVIKSRTKAVLVDERVQAVSDKAAHMAFTVGTLVMAIGSFIFIFVGKTLDPYLEGLGFILSYITLFSLMIYSVAFYFYNRKFGADDEE